VLSRDSDGRPACLTGINWDVTESRQKEQAISAALQEKDTLLRELYHRVKNNLQVISSLLDLQLRTLPEEAARTALQESANRVRAMALVHEKLYQSKNLSSISLDDYIADLCRHLGNAAGADQRGITMHALVEAVEVGLQVAIPVGLVLNELLANSLRHAFPDGRRGSITVHLESQDGGCLLRVVDDGVGMPTGMNPASSTSLGLKLVHALTAQLDGRFQIRSGHGTEACLTFHRASGGQASVAQGVLATATPAGATTP
jgi:two-component sensor histidine kinase